jgi:uncharacterized membrane protein
MNTLIIVLRLIHIFGGIFWVGGALYVGFVVIPSLNATAEAGQKVLGYIMTQSKSTMLMMTAAISTVTAGFILYGIDSSWFTSPWMHAGAGAGFAIGGFFGLIGFVAGLMVPSTGKALGKLAAQIQGAPTPEQAAQLAALRKRQALISKVNTYSLIITAIFMSTARYLHF